ncbi:hypothetical protein HD806DRAFT_552320 [Xylariaceae sp. AK1471]|nr:hypothetical protein HD806DRAFT_552320 [Xylariaceae sp. AK1471]
MSVQSWASRARSSEERQNVESQHLVDIFERLLTNQSTPEQAATDINAVLEPLMRTNPADLRIISVWGILCHAVRELGNDRQRSHCLVEFLESMKKLQIKDEAGNDLKHDWGGRFWSDLPAFGMMFRDYGIALESDDDLETNKWLAQKTEFLNASSFAATALASTPELSGFTFHFLNCMNETFGGVDDMPAPGVRAAMYIPAVWAWISIGGTKIYELCRESKVSGFGMDNWESWKKRLDEIAADDSIGSEERALALKAKDVMINIQNETGNS